MKRRNLLKLGAGTMGAVPFVTFSGTAKAQSAGPVIAVISHPVKDYAAWRAVYDSVERLRKQASVSGAEVFRDPKDQNQVVVIHRFPNLDAAQGFLGNPALKEAMAKGGVTAPPTITLAVAA